MKILMLAPEPFFQARGTPISVFFRIQALTGLGHRVDLITYPLGEDLAMPGLRIRRVPNVLSLRKIKIGPSAAKIPLDALMSAAAVWALARGRYDLIFSHEEAALIGAALARLWRLPHIYDMHSSLPQQLENFQFSRSTLLKDLFRKMENFILKRSRAVIVICKDLEKTVRQAGHGDKVVRIENVLDFPPRPFSAAELESARRKAAPGGEKIILYAGNFGPYQGISLLLQAATLVKERAVFLLLGGSRADREEMGRAAARLGIAGKVIFRDRVPPAEVPFYIALADVLVSPRLSGTNTPLKIYSFLKSGKPLVVTNLWTHTQVVDERTAILADPSPESLAEGLSFALTREDAQVRARAAKELAGKEYTQAAYYDKIERCLRMAVGDSRRGV